MTAVKEHPLVATVLAVQRRHGEKKGGYLAVVVSYYAFLSIFPLMLLGLSAVGFVLARDPVMQAEWVGRVSDVVPGLGPLLGDNLEAVVDARGGVGVLGLLGLLWTGTSLTQAAGYVMSRVYDTPTRTGFVRVKSWALRTTVTLGALAMAGMALAGAVGGARGTGVVGTLLRLGGVPVTVAVDFLLFAMAYKLLLPRPGPAFERLWKGALVAALGWAALKMLGSWYAARTVAGATAVYGAFGSVVGVLALLYLGARLFVYGALFNTLEWGPRPEDGSTAGRSSNRPGLPREQAWERMRTVAEKTHETRA